MPNFPTSISRITVFCGLLLSLSPLQALAQTGSCDPSIGEAFLDINNVRARILNNGGLFWDIQQSSGYEVPRGSGIDPIYVANLWVGANVGQEAMPRVAACGMASWISGPAH